MITLDILAPVVVENNMFKPLTHALALGLHLWVSTEGSCKRLFYCPSTITVLHTLISTYVCGGVEVKRISLTQGERLLEGATPTDKQTLGLMTTTCRRNSGLINKAVAGIKGQTPMPTPKVGELDLVPSPTLVIIV